MSLEHLHNSDRTPRLVPPTGGLQQVIQTRLAAIHQDTPKIYPLFYRVYSGVESPRRVEVANCTTVTCPLHSVRPYQKEGETDE